MAFFSQYVRNAAKGKIHKAIVSYAGKHKSNIEKQNIMNHEILKKIGYNSVALEMLLKREAQINTDNLKPEQDDSDFETLYNLQNNLLDFMEEVRTAELPRKTDILNLLEQAFDIISENKSQYE